MSRREIECSARGTMSAVRRAPAIIAASSLVLGAWLVWLTLRAESRTNHVALAQSPRSVTVIRAAAAPFVPSRRYVASVEPWLEARVGPQLVSAYVETVLVRPGDAVRKGDVLATLDCRHAGAASEAVAMMKRLRFIR